MAVTPHESEVPQFDIHDRLRKARESVGLSPVQLAKTIQVSKATVYNYEGRATKRLKPLVLKQWALATGVPPQWLETGTDPHSNGPDGGSDLPNSRSSCTVVRPAQWATPPALAAKAA